MAYIFAADSMGLSSFNFFVVGSERRIFSATDINLVPKSATLDDLERPTTNRKGVCDFLLVINSSDSTFYTRLCARYKLLYCIVIVTLVLSCTVSDIRRLIGRKLRIFPTPLSFNALARGEPVRISGWNLYYHAKTRGMGLLYGDPSFSRFCMNHLCDKQTDGRTDRQTDGIAIAYARLA